MALDITKPISKIMYNGTEIELVGAGMASLPKFTYTGNYGLIDDNDGNWRIKFFTSGILTMIKAATVDVFLVGGGGGGGGLGDGGSYGGGTGGGGGGYTNTITSVGLKENSTHTIVVGAGGLSGHAGSSTSFDTLSVNGGQPGAYHNSSQWQQDKGGDGGSGGGAGNGTQYPSGTYTACAGGSNGSNGGAHSTSWAGIGQGSTTREFGESTGDLYAGGGGGGGGSGTSSSDAPGAGGAGGGGAGGKLGIAATSGTANTGGGGGGGHNTYGLGAGGMGGSGIVIIRNAR